MPSTHLDTSLVTLQRVERSAGELSTAATRRMEASHEWYRALSAEDRSWVGLVAQAGIGAFIAWLRAGGDQVPVTADVFGTAPRELTRSITLRQTLDLVRSVVDVVELDATALAEPGEEQALRESVLRYSREIAFAAAEVYAHAAEARGAWDARLEGLVVDAVLRGEADDSMQSRAAALGWGTTTRVAVVAGSTPSGSPAGVVDGLRRAAQRVGVDTLAAIQGRRLVCILGNAEDPLEATRAVTDHFGDGPVVVGPRVPHLFAAGRSARAALAGQSCAHAWPHAPRPVAADDLLAERVLVGDAPARALLLDRIWHPLSSASGSLLATASVYLESAGGLEGTARLLFVHPNTVRYRLGKIADLTGYQLTDPHDAHTVRIALALGRLRSVR
ncbi:helix-turn-helix domain-containing protein [Pedococcus sp.]|jgi:DNA-binding PucR family transcriptional regulator|uniref:PucR family transcriptional regulator n=1 Tax=Pedococcus sp. TaxID=2860345 RepID=UPI002E0D91AE|nr:helix-turn-helix domain-containing protein [Pedococcus sp.]